MPSESLVNKKIIPLHFQILHQKRTSCPPDTPCLNAAFNPVEVANEDGRKIEQGLGLYGTCQMAGVKAYFTPPLTGVSLNRFLEVHEVTLAVNLYISPYKALNTLTFIGPPKLPQLKTRLASSLPRRHGERDVGHQDNRLTDTHLGFMDWSLGFRVQGLRLSPTTQTHMLTFFLGGGGWVCVGGLGLLKEGSRLEDVCLPINGI